MFNRIVAGDTLRLEVVLPAYPANAGWTLRYRFTPRTPGGVAIDLNTAASGAAHLLLVAAGTTAAWATDAYHCTAWVTNGAGERYTIPSETGALDIAPNPATLPPGTDARSQLERDLEAVTLVLSGKAGSGVESYRIAGRELHSYPLPDLIKLQRKLQSELDAERVAQGLAPRHHSGPQRILVRMP